MDLDNHIELNRTFIELDTENISEQTQEYEGQIRHGQATWGDVLKQPRVVLLAEAGAGKTQELRIQSRKLNETGGTAFFLRLEQLSDDLDLAFEEGTREDFDEWLGSDQRAWFFLDSVDEARMSGFRQYEKALKKFSKSIGSEHLQRANVVITSRPSEWRPVEDLDNFKSYIPFYVLKSEENPEENNSDDGIWIDDDEEDEGSPEEEVISVRSVSDYKEDELEIAEPSAYGLTDFNDPAVLEFSRARGVENSDQFLQEIERSGAHPFASRPLDLDRLITFWKAKNEVPSPKNLLEFTISEKLKERDEDRNQARQLSKDDARLGAEMLAAACTFQKLSRIAVPGADNTGSMHGAVDAREILGDWEAPQIAALLARPVFDQQTYGSVRFYHRSVREYLTANWLSKLLEMDGAHRKVSALFFQNKYGCDVVLPSLRPVLSWLATFDNEFQRKMLEAAPEILLESGDPSVLSVESRKYLLNTFCGRLAENSAYYRHKSFESANLRRIAHPELIEDVRALFNQYSDNEEVLEFLFDFVWYGELRECFDFVQSYALKPYQDAYRQIHAISAFKAIASEVEATTFVHQILADTPQFHHRISGELVHEFAPQSLTIQDVLRIIESTAARGKYSYPYLKYSVEELIREKLNLEQQVELFHGLGDLIQQEPHIPYDPISQKHKWLIDSLVQLSKEIIVNRVIEALNDKSLAVFSILQQGVRRHGHGDDHKSIRDLVCGWDELRKALFWFDVNQARKENEQSGKRITHPSQAGAWRSFWKFDEPDFEWALGQIPLQSCLDDQLILLFIAIAQYIERGRDRKDRYALKKVASSHKKLTEELHCFFHPSPISEEEKAMRRKHRRWDAQDKKRKLKQEENEAKWLQWIRENHHELIKTCESDAPTIINAHIYLYRDIDRESSQARVANGNWQSLIPKYGTQVADSFRRSCILFWRGFKPILKSEMAEQSNSILWEWHIGLSGIEMEYHENPCQFVSKLSPEEAEIAARYALKEMNEFPVWLPEIYHAHPQTVENIFKQEIAWQLTGECDEHHYVLHDTFYRAGWLHPAISDWLLDELSKNPPKNQQSLKYALGIVLATESVDANKYQTCAEQRIAKGIKCSEEPIKLLDGEPHDQIVKGIESSEAAMWISGLICINPEEGLAALQSLLEVAPNREPTKIMVSLLNLMFDDRFDRYCPEHNKLFDSVANVGKLFKLACRYIHPSEDIERGDSGPYSPTPRDEAQRSRGYLLERLKNIPGKQTYEILLDIYQDFSDVWIGERCAELAIGRAENDAEFLPWLPEDIASFAIEVEKKPSNHQELYSLAVSRLIDLKHDLENGDSSEASTWQKIADEPELRVLIGNRLRQRASGRYSIPQEEEMADGKKPDIRFHSSEIDAPIPVEIKISDNWSANDLRERLQNQLIGQYLRDTRSNMGIYLLVYKGEKPGWSRREAGENYGSFAALVSMLDDHSDELVQGLEGVEQIAVIGIDLTRRHISQGSIATKN